MKTDTRELIMFDATLDKVNEELGFNIFEKYVGSGVFVSNVNEDSAAAREGSIRPGDRIVKVNDMNVESSSHEDVAKLLKSTKGRVHLGMSRLEKGKPVSESTSYIASLLTKIERESSKLQHAYNLKRANYEYDRGPNDHFVEIEKNPSQNVGISISGGRSSPLGDVPVFVAMINRRGPAVGKLEEGDLILSINGQATEGKTHEEIVWMIKGSADAIVLMKVRRGEKEISKLIKYLTETAHSATHLITSSLSVDMPEISSEGTQSDAEPPVTPKVAFTELSNSEVKARLEIVLDQSSDGLGFSVVGGIGSIHGDLPIFVKSIYNSGSAATEGRLRRGDRILAVNGESLDGCTHGEGVALLKKAKGKVVLSVIPT